MIRLDERDYIVTAYCEHASGPGWANWPVWVVIRDGNGKLREECLQPKEHAAHTKDIYAIAAATHGLMRVIAERCAKRKRKTKTK